jgi:hypothetical protein
MGLGTRSPSERRISCFLPGRGALARLGAARTAAHVAVDGYRATGALAQTRHSRIR